MKPGTKTISEKIAAKWVKVLGVEPDVGNKKRVNRGRVCVLTKDYRWINHVVKIKVRSKFVDVRVIENMEFNVDFDSDEPEEDHSSWVSETPSNNDSAESLMEDEQSGDEDEATIWPCQLNPKRHAAKR